MAIANGFDPDREKLERNVSGVVDVPKVVLGLIFAVISAVSFWDGYRIATTLRRPGVYDGLGPDRYLIAVGIIILLLGIALIVQGSSEMRESKMQSTEEPGSNRHFWLLGAVCAYAMMIWLFGYAISTFAFFVAALWIMGQCDWRWNLSSAVALTVAFVLIFEHAADISLPKGIFG